jgi:hypothetical protein
MTTLVATSNPATVGQTVTLTATITGGDFAAGSNPFVAPFDGVTFLDGGGSLGTVMPAATGGPGHESRARFSASGLSAGSHSLTAHYNGGFDILHLLSNGSSTSDPVTVVVNVPPPPPPPVSDVTGQVSVTPVRHGHHPGALRQQLMLKNVGAATVQGPVYLVLDGLPTGVRLKNAAGSARGHARPGDPFLTAAVSLLPGGEVSLTLLFWNPRHKHITFATEVFAGPGAV